MRRESILAIGSTALALVLVELLLATFFPQRTVKQYLEDRPAMYRADEVLFMDLQPGFEGFLREEEFRTTISINSLGYRQGEFAIEKTDAARVLVVGDSFTFGYGVEESDGYVRVLERVLAASSSSPVQVINAGVPSWWTDAYYLYLKTRGLALAPDVVVLGLFTGNDIDGRDAQYATWPEVDEKGLPLSIASERVRIENGHRVRMKRRARWTIPVLRNSHAFQLLYTSVQNLGRAASPKTKGATLYGASYSPETEAVLDKVRQLIAAMAEMTRAAGGHFLVVMIPERTQVYLEDSSTGGLDYEKPHALFGAFFEAQGIDYLDLLGPIRAAARAGDEALYYKRDSHFTAAGYRLAGEAIARHLIDSGTLERRR